MCARLLTALISHRPKDPTVFGVNLSNSFSFTELEVMISWFDALNSGCFYLNHLAVMFYKNQICDDFQLQSRTLKVGNIDIGLLSREHLDKLIKSMIFLLSTTSLPNLRVALTKKLDELFRDVLVRLNHVFEFFNAIFCQKMRYH